MAWQSDQVASPKEGSVITQRSDKFFEPRPRSSGLARRATKHNVVALHPESYLQTELAYIFVA